MAGWNLKESILIGRELNIEEFQEMLDFIDNSPQQNSYKLLLLYIILKCLRENVIVISKEEILLLVVKEYVNILEKYTPNEKEKNTLLYKTISKGDFDISNEEKIKKEFRFFFNYVFGALSQNTKNNLFGFSDRNVNLNINLKKILTENILEGIIEKIKSKFFIKRDNIKEKNIMLGYQQKFELQVDYILNLLNKDNFLELKSSEITTELGIGVPKYQALKQYMMILDLIKDNKKTELFYKIMDMKGNADFIEPLLYYKVVRSPEKGGHYVFSEFINETLYTLYLEGKWNLAKKVLLDESLKVEHSKIKDDGWKKLIGVAFSSLKDSETGFGKIGIIEETLGANVEIHSYWVEPLVAAYIIYDLWEENQVAKSIKEIETEKYNIGRIFLMDSEAVMETLSEIEALKLITIETIAGLNQIRINPKITKEDILDMIIKEA